MAEKTLPIPIEAPHRESQRDRVATMLAELDAEYGPIDPQRIEEVRRAWPAHKRNKR
jgi:hypothetical protein